MLRSFRNWKVVAGLIASTNLIGSGAVLAQGWGEQRPLQFEIVGAGGSAMTAEIYRRQFLLGSQQLGVARSIISMAAAAAVAAAAEFPA